MSHVSHKLSNSVEGALAGGGDPATSPLYVFGPFLKLIVVGGIAQVTFGASVWLVVLTVVAVSAMYRLVMTWVTDGSGGSGLSEEELGSWAVKVNAGITFVEYTLTFLVSIAALVTFLADRVPALDRAILGVPLRTLVAVGVSILTGWLVNRGPKMAARAFGPATAAILLLLWVMIIATIARRGLHLPSVHLEAFTPKYLHFTIGGYARILALMTGIEIFANLVSAYSGTAAQRSAMAFKSLLIIMGTTCLTMVVVGPAILALSNPHDEKVSVFTQTMDKLLPAPLPYVGTLIGIAVLLSAAAASAQGLQNLALGLRYRHYIPAWLGERNRHDVADKPVWLEVALCCVCFVAFGTHEETYLALYAAGVFVLLSLTGWAAVKRLVRHAKGGISLGGVTALGGTILAAVLTSLATAIIFRERFVEGAWSYLIFIPLLYGAFSYYRKRLGEPSQVEDRLGRVVAEKRYLPAGVGAADTRRIVEHVLLALDGSAGAEQALALSATLAIKLDATLHVFGLKEGSTPGWTEAEQGKYLDAVSGWLDAEGIDHETHRPWLPAGEAVRALVKDRQPALVVTASASWSGGSAAKEIAKDGAAPLLVVRPGLGWRARWGGFGNILVALAGAAEAEQSLPYVRAFADNFGGEAVLLSVPEGSESESFPETIGAYLEGVREAMEQGGVVAKPLVTGSGASRTIEAIIKSEPVDMVVLTTHGRGGVGRADYVQLGSVAEKVVAAAGCPVLLVPAAAPSPGSVRAPARAAGEASEAEDAAS